MRPIVIEGHKGAGKTPLINALKLSLDSAGVNYRIAEPWQEAIKHYGEDPYYIFTDPKRARDICFFLTRNVKSELQEAGEDTLLIFDRQWLTFFTSVTLIDLKESKITQEDLKYCFDIFMSCNPWSYFIASTPYVLKNRKGRRGCPPWDEGFDYWTRLRLYYKNRDLFGGIEWVRKPRINMENLSHKILSNYYNNCRG